MQLFEADLRYWGVILLAFIVIIYFLPFLMSLWIKPVASLWGFIVGRRQRNSLISIEYPERKQSQNPDSSNDSAEVPNSLNNYASQVSATESFKQEFAYLDDMHKKKIDYLDGRLESLDKRVANIDRKYQERQQKDKHNFPGNAYHATLSELNKNTAKDFVLLLIISALFIADTLIAQQVFTSLGLFPTDKYVILGKEISLTFILGLFLTAVSALFLHILWDRDTLKGVKKKKAGLFIGLSTLLLLATLRFISVVAPVYAKSVVEMALIFGWLMGIVVFYWLLGDILGESDNWHDLLIAIGLPILLTLVIFFGIIFLLEKIIEGLMKTAFDGWFKLGHARTMKQKQNTEESYQATLRGYYRGLTF